TVSPSPTIEPTPPVVADSPTPTAASVSRTATEKRSNVAKAPARKPTSASAGAADSEPSAPRSAERATPPPASRTSTLFEGRAISVFTSSDLSTKTARSGQKFTASLANPIVDGDWVIAKKGAPVEGVVVNSDPGGRVNGTAFISVRLESLTLADGRRVNLDTTLYTKEAKSSKAKDAAKVGIGAG